MSSAMAEECAGPLILGKRSREPSDERPIASVTVMLENAAATFEYSVEDEDVLVCKWLQQRVTSLPPGIEIADLSGPSRIPVSLDEPMAHLQALRRSNVRIRLSAPVGLQFAPTEKENLNREIARVSEEQNWGDAVDTLALDRARDAAIRAHPGDLEKQLRFLLEEVRGSACKFLVRISRNQSLPISMGDELLVDVQCQDRLGLPARLTQDLRVDLKVVGSSYRGNESVVPLGEQMLSLSDAAMDSKWPKRPIFFLPQEQPKNSYPMKYVLTVTAHDDHDLFGDSNEWTFREEKIVDGSPVIVADEVYKFHSEHSQMMQWQQARTNMFATGGEAEIWHTKENGIVVRHLHADWWDKQRNAAVSARREFLMDVCAWKRISEKCGTRVAQLKGWYLLLDEATPHAGFRLKHYEMSLDSALQKTPNLMERFELALGVTTAMLELRAAFPSLVFLDIKPVSSLLPPLPSTF